MRDTEYRQLIQAAQDKALFGFLAVLQRALQDADRNLGVVLGEAQSGLERNALIGARHFLLQDGNGLLRRAEALYRGYLERAMRTMYRDLRPDMRKLSADELSLIDDDAVSHQIEVGRLAQRMRDANEEGIGRLNVIVARLHGEVEARERENPFRPYLLARVVHEAIREAVADESREALLYEHLAAAMIPHLAGFFAAIQQVFETSGIHGRFVAQPSRAAHNQRYFGAPHTSPVAAAPALAPGLHRLLHTWQQGVDGLAIGNEQAPSAQQLIRSMLAPKRKPMQERPARPVSPLVAQLDRFQKALRDHERKNAASAGAQEAQPALRAQLELDKASVMERMTVEVVDMLFQILADDEQIPAPLRAHLARLQAPTLKAALLQPALMHDDRHPARRLLNRMSAAAVGIDPDSAAGHKLRAEMERTVSRVLDRFEADPAAFADGLHEFEQFLGNVLREGDHRTAPASEAIESAERYSVLLADATRALREVLFPLSVDKRISDFIIAVWPQVLVKSAWLDASRGSALHEQYRTLPPELIWSIQDKADPQERARLVRMLPDLVRRLRAGMELVELPEQQAQQVLDLLVTMHAQILRGGNRVPAGLPTLEMLQREFVRIAIHWERANWGQSEPPEVRQSVIEQMLAGAGVRAECRLGGSAPVSPADREFLVQACPLGARGVLRADIAIQLVWISTHRSLYLFRGDDGRLYIYSAAALLEAFGAQDIVLLEHAPAFERAVESLLSGAEKLAESA